MIFPCQTLTYEHTKEFYEFYSFKHSIIQQNVQIFTCFGRCHMECTHYHEVCLEAFTDNLFALSQLVTSSNSLFINSILLLISLCEYKMVVSSANNIKSSTFEVYVISFTYNIKRRGPSIEPCGTPHVIFPGSEVQLLNVTNCVLLLR